MPGPYQYQTYGRGTSVVSGDVSRASSSGATVSGQFPINHLLGRAGEEALGGDGGRRRTPREVLDTLAVHDHVEVGPGSEREPDSVSPEGKRLAARERPEEEQLARRGADPNLEPAVPASRLQHELRPCLRRGRDGWFGCNGILGGGRLEAFDRESPVSRLGG